MRNAFASSRVTSSEFLRHSFLDKCRPRNKFSVLLSTSFVAVLEKKEHLGDRAYRDHDITISNPISGY